MNNPEILEAAADTVAMMARTLAEMADATISDPWNEWRLYARAVTGYDVAADLFEEAGKPKKAKKARIDRYEAKVRRNAAAARQLRAKEAEARGDRADAKEAGA